LLRKRRIAFRNVTDIETILNRTNAFIDDAVNHIFSETTILFRSLFKCGETLFMIRNLRFVSVLLVLEIFDAASKREIKLTARSLDERSGSPARKTLHNAMHFPASFHSMKMRAFTCRFRVSRRGHANEALAAFAAIAPA